MAPVQASVNLDQDNETHSFAKDAVPMKSYSSSGSPSKVSACMSNPHDMVVQIENESDEQDCNIVTDENREDSDATEDSSSFEGTESFSGLSDAEVESAFNRESFLLFGDLRNRFPVKNKKLTSHWRNFINPLRWRCKWAELKIKEFQSQANKYDRELAAYEERKRLQLDHGTPDGSKSLPFTSERPGKMVMERRKRKRIEDTADVELFMSEHNLFSYHAEKKYDSEGILVTEDSGNPEKSNARNEERERIGGFSFHEQTFDCSSCGKILLKIESEQSRVKKLKAELVGMTGENSLKLSSSENLNLLVPGELPNSSTPTPAFAAFNEEAQPLGTSNDPGLDDSEYDIGEFLLPDSEISDHGEDPFF